MISSITGGSWKSSIAGKQRQQPPQGPGSRRFSNATKTEWNSPPNLNVRIIITLICLLRVSPAPEHPGSRRADPHLPESIQDKQQKQGRQPESAPQDDPHWQQERITRAQRAAALAEKQEEERQRTRYVLKSVTQTVGGVSYVIESAARRQLNSIPYKTGNDALIGLAKGTYYVSTAAGVGSALLHSNPAASLDRASRTVTSAQLAAHSNDAIRRRRELKSQILETQQALFSLSSKPPDKRTAAKQAQLRADLSAMRREKTPPGQADSPESAGQSVPA